MYLRSEATWKTFMAGCFMLALSPRADTAEFFEYSPPSHSLNLEERLHLLPTSGTLGAGLEYRYDITKNINMRFAYSSMDYALANVSHSVSYDLSLKMLSRSVIFDWRPFGGSFRTSAGMIFGGPSLTGTASSVDTSTLVGQTITGSDIQYAVSGINPAHMITVGQWSISGAEAIKYSTTVNSNQSVGTANMTISERDLGSVSGIARYPDNAPYIGIGWGNISTQKGRLLYSVDLGVMYLGRPKVELSLHGPVADIANGYYSAETQAYLAEEQQKIEALLSRYRYFPVFSVSLWYSF